MNESTKPQLSFTLDATWAAGVLRVDAIRRGGTLALGAAWRETGGADDITAALEDLADAAGGDPSPEELDSLVDAVEEAGCMPPAQIAISLEDALRMRAELDAVIAGLSRFNPARAERGAA
jgi:hypothetical protein